MQKKCTHIIINVFGLKKEKWQKLETEIGSLIIDFIFTRTQLLLPKIHPCTSDHAQTGEQ